MKSYILLMCILGLFYPAVAFSGNAALSEIQKMNYDTENKIVNSTGENKQEGSESSPLKKNIRDKAMKSAASSLGAQSGYLYHFNSLKLSILDSSDEMDSIFDFNTIMKLASVGNSEMFFQPPVLQESENVTAVNESETQLRISGRVWNIIEKGKLVSAPINWRAEILYDESIETSQVSSVLLPRSDRPDEQARWSEWVIQGWAMGVNQAEMEMAYRLRVMGSRYIGMIKYMRLLAIGKIKNPVVAESTQHVIGGGNSMIENDKLYQLTIPAQLNSNHNDWRVLVFSSRGSLRNPMELKANE